jgi:uncharacterized protein YyaL (SSP411 family)
MDETSYSDPVITNVINKSFVPIRVDTDKRPDINRRYNLGGWPTTAFLDPDGKIITGGTYIPPQQLRELLRSVLDFYSNNKGKMRSKILPPRIPSPKDEQLSEKILRDISTTVAVNFDIDYGGFGFEPKFPQADALDYAFLRYRYYGEKEMLTVATKTLDHMAEGGIYDQVEKGFFRYSTTRDWSIPHFEKMAEDNAKLLNVYLHAYQITSKRLYRDTAEGILQYVHTHLSDQEHGGFFGSQDANEEYYKRTLAARKTGPAPRVDKTLYSNYNALLISSHLLASIVLGSDSTAKFALKSLDRILDLGKQGSLPFHYWKDNETPMLRGLLTDYATLINCLIDAFEYSSDTKYLQVAVKTAEDCISTLQDPKLGGFYDIPPSDSNLGELSTRDKPIDENSIVALGLLRLSWIIQRDDYAKVAERALQLFNQDYERHGLASAVYALALDSLLKGPLGITIVASEKSKQFAEFKKTALSVYSARRYVAYLDPKRDTETIRRLGYSTETIPAAYVCVGKTCGPPVKEPSQMESTLSSLLEEKPVLTS